MPRARFSSRKRSLAALIAALVLALAAPAAAAKLQIHGIVLSVSPQTGEAVVRHDPFGGMPSMAMTFRILPRERAKELLPGNEIDATVDTSKDEWTLSGIRVVTEQAVTPLSNQHVALLHAGDTVPDQAFVDQSGRPFRFSQLRGQDVVLAFVYTRCQDPQMCPLISTHFAALQRLAGARKLHLVEITLDPSYDRPPVLARYARLFGADPRRWTLAVGDAQPTLDFAARFGIVVFPDPQIGIIHSENTVEIAPDGTIGRMYPDASWQPAGILADIDARDAAESDPLARLRLLALENGPLALGLLVLAAGAYLAFRLGRGMFANDA